MAKKLRYKEAPYKAKLTKICEDMIPADNPDDQKPGITKIESVNDLKVGDTATINVNLSAGKKDGKPTNPIKKGTKVKIIKIGLSMATIRTPDGKIHDNIIKTFLNK